jgi:hypothetical protein
MSKPISFKLKNGLEATLFPTKNPRVAQCLNKCVNKTYLCEDIPVWMMEVRVENESVCFFYQLNITGFKAIAKQLRGRLDLLSYNYLIVYNDVSYPFGTDANMTIAIAVTRKVKPCLSALLNP